MHHGAEPVPGLPFTSVSFKPSKERVFALEKQQISLWQKHHQLLKEIPMIPPSISPQNSCNCLTPTLQMSVSISHLIPFHHFHGYSCWLHPNILAEVFRGPEGIIQLYPPDPHMKDTQWEHFHCGEFTP